MAGKRRIVPDCSVLIPAYFRETITATGRELDLTGPAKRLRNAIDLRELVAYAPELLGCEFLAATRAKTSTRHGGEALSMEKAREQIDRFAELWDRFVWVPWHQLVEVAWNLTASRAISPPDAWYLACTRQHNAELWISHEHGDGFASHARRVHDRVYTLTEDSFDRV